MARSREFNTPWRASLAPAVLGAVIAVFCGTVAHADEVRKWRDAEGNLHYSVTGSEGESSGGGEGPVLGGRAATAEESFSVEASLRRRQIETKLRSSARALDEARSARAEAEKRSFNAWVPSLTANPQAAQASLDAQRYAFLAAGQFEQEKAEAVRHWRRQERDKLKEIIVLWKDFATLDASVTERYGTSPTWWRRRLECGTCPTLAEAERVLHDGPVAKAAPEAAEKEKGKESAEAPGEDDEKWEDDGWE